jgi:hypothetical protein
MHFSITVSACHTPFFNLCFIPVILSV